MTKYYLLLSVLCMSTIVNAQNLGVGTTTPNAKLDITASNVATPTNQDGILIPRVNAFPVANPGSNQNGMMIYLTTTAGANLPGFYYWDNNSTTWKAVGNGKFWGLSGNAGTIAGTHFIGTTDNIPFSIRVNNAPGARIDHIKFNTFLGSGAGNIGTTGERNVAIGSDALQVNTTGEKNTTVGGQSLNINTTGSNNSVYGYDAMYQNGTGNRNTAMGVNALGNNISGSDNIAVGLNALVNIETGNNNLGIGLSAGYNNHTGSGNVFIGYEAGYYETGSNKLYIQNSDVDANNALIYGEFDNKLLRVNGNMGIGTAPNAKLEVVASNPATPTNQDGILIPRVDAFPATNPGSNQNGMMIYLTTTAGTNLPGFYYWENNSTTWKAVGSGKFWGLTGNAGTNPATHFYGTTDNNDVIFKRNNTRSGLLGSRNTSWGFGALNPASTGLDNTAIGTQSLSSNTNGNYNTANGYQSLFNNLGGESNTANGYQSLFTNATGSFNTAYGKVALGLNTSGNDNTAIGAEAGYHNVSGNRNIFIGSQAGLFETGSNKLYIQNSDVDANNALIYGEFDNKLLRSNGRMQIFSDNSSNDGLRVVKNYAAGTFQDKIGVYGQNTVDNNYGIGVEGQGGFIGVNGICTGIGSGNFYGTRGVSNGSTSGVNYGVYGNALNGNTNYSGYFETNTYVGGNLGIGVTSPGTKLSLNGGNGEAFTIFNGGDVRIYNDAGTASSLFYASGGTGANNSVFTILSDGKTFTFNGTGGSVSSDARLKQDIVPLTGSLQKLMQLNGYSYRFKTKADIQAKEIGVLAQEVKKVLPEAVFTNDDGTYSVSYNSLVPLLINAVKDQQKVVESQEERIKKLEMQMMLLLKNK